MSSFAISHDHELRSIHIEAGDPVSPLAGEERPKEIYDMSAGGDSTVAPRREGINGEIRAYENRRDVERRVLIKLAKHE